MPGCIASKPLARSALLLVLLVGFGGGCQGVSPAAHAPPMAGASIEGLPEPDAAAVLRLAEAVGIQDIDRVIVYDSDSCTVCEQPRRVDEIATSQRCAFMWREGTWAERPDALTVVGWCTLPSLDRFVTSHVPVGGRTVDAILDGVSSAEALRILSALAAGTVAMPDGVPRFDMDQVTGMMRPVGISPLILRLGPEHPQLDPSDVRVRVSQDRLRGLCLIIHLAPTEARCVSWTTFE
jgi:hypothetical protein